MLQSGDTSVMTKNGVQRLNLGNKKLEQEAFQQLIFSPTTRIEISPEVLQRVAQNHAFLKEFSKGKVIYGVNTGFGPMAQFIINPKDSHQLQYNLIRSHAAGMGQFLPPLYAKSVMLARLNNLLLARSGVHESVVILLKELLNREIYPCIPEHGSVGASGDLVQLAHLALSLIGEGKVYYKGELHSAKEALAKEGLTPIEMHLREGLALINGTAAMTGIGLINLTYARRLLRWSVLLSAMLNEIAEAYEDHFSAALNGAKLHKGQNQVAEWMRTILGDSQLIRKRAEHLYFKPIPEGKSDDKIQEYYSLRCIPQILGPVADTLQYAEEILVNELNSANDNPLVFEEENNVYHGGNFHGDYVALEMDKVKIAITRLSMLCERQLNYLLNSKLNNKLPPFANLGQLGLNFGMQGAQFTATSTTAENQTLAFPMYVHSIPNNNDNQDIVSMGTNAALLTKKVIDNTFEVIAIQAVTMMQAIDYLNIAERLSSASRAAYFEIRAIVPIFEQDAVLSERLQAVKTFLQEKEAQEM